MKNKSFILTLILLLPGSTFAVENGDKTRDFAGMVQAEIVKGNIIRRVTDISEFKNMFGAPINEETAPDGGGTFTKLAYPDGGAAWFKQMQTDSPIVLSRLFVNGRTVDLGKPLLRDTSDLLKLDSFLGLQGVSLAKLDLRDSKEFLLNMSFDSLTEWPAKEKLPAGFDPARILENGENPGLGIKKLHKAGITGRGVGIAIIDQPLLLGHKEYVSRIIYYNAAGLAEVGPQMHGPSVASFAVGENIGTAPEAVLYYLAVPSWKADNVYYTDALNTIIEMNKSLPANEKIRVVSISTGMFRQFKNYDKWLEALHKAEGNNILMITCDPDTIKFGNLTRDLEKDMDFPESYMPESWDTGKYPLWVPGGRRTRASYQGAELYVFDAVGGRSWSTPYLAGVAALGFQVNPGLTPEAVKEMLIKSASPGKYGNVLNPAGFIDLAQRSLKK